MNPQDPQVQELLQGVPEEERAAVLEYLQVEEQTPQEQPAQEAAPETPDSVEVNIDEDIAQDVENQGFDLGAVVKDVVIGVPEGIAKGAINSVGETLEGVYGLADGAANLVGGDLPDQEYKPMEADTQTGKVLEPVSRFVTGFVGAGKFLKMAGWASKGGKALQAGRAAVQGGLADFFSFDGHEERLSNMIQENPNLKNPVTEYLASDPNDSEAEGRFKNLVEGLGLGVATDGLVTAVKRLKGIRVLRETKGDEGAAKYLAEHADEADEGLGALFPNVKKEVEGKVVTGEQLPPLTDEAGNTVSNYVPPINEDKAVEYAKAVNKAMEEGFDPTKIDLTPYMNPEAFSSPEQMEQLVNTIVATMRDTDKVISHKMSIEEAEKMFSDSVSSLADISGVSKENLTQTMLQDAESIREAGVRSVVAINAIQVIEKEIDRLIPLADNLDPDALKQIEALREAAYRIIPARSAVGTELGRALNLQKVEPTFGQDAANLLKDSQMSTQEWLQAYKNAKNAHAKGKLLQLGADTITRVRINAMLSGPITQVANLTSNIIKTAVTPTEHILGGAALKMTGQAGGDEALRQGTALYRGMYSALSDSWRMAGTAIKNRKGVFRGGEFSQLDVFEDLSKIENNFTSPEDALKWTNLKESADKLQEAFEAGDIDSLTSMVWSTGLRTFGAVVDLPSTLLNGADEFFLNLNGRAMLYSGLMEQGMSKGLKGAELSQFVEESFQKYFNSNGALIQSDELGKKAFAYATDSNFSTEMTDDTIFGKVGMALRNTQEGGGGFGFAMQNIAPFVRTPVNLVVDVFNHVPGVNALLNKQVRDDLMAGGMRRARRIGEMTTGSMFLATAMSMVSQGMITGSGPTDPELRKQWMKAGWRPYSIKLPDGNYFEIARFEPYSTYFAVLADYAEAKQAGMQGDDEEFYRKLVASAANNLTSKKYLTGLIDVMDLMSGLGHGDYESIEKFARNFAGSFAPSIGKNVREIQDPLLRDARSIADGYRNRTPFLSESVPVSYDFRGKPELTPILSLYSRSEMDEIDKEVLRLGQLGGQVDTVSSRDRKMLSKFTNKDGKTAYERLGELMGEVGKSFYKDDFQGKNLTEYLQEVLKGTEYQEAADPFTSGDVSGQGGKVAILRDAINTYREAALDRLRVEGFKDQNGKHLMAFEEEKKYAEQVFNQQDKQELEQEQGTLNEQIQNFIEQYN